MHNHVRNSINLSSLEIMFRNYLRKIKIQSEELQIADDKRDEIFIMIKNANDERLLALSKIAVDNFKKNHRLIGHYRYLMGAYEMKKQLLNTEHKPF